MIIVWKRRGHFALTLPAVAVLAYKAAAKSPSITGQATTILIAAVAVVILGILWNRGPDVEEDGKHLLLGIPMELWGMATIGLQVLELLARRAST